MGGRHGAPAEQAVMKRARWIVGLLTVGAIAVAGLATTPWERAPWRHAIPLSAPLTRPASPTPVATTAAHQTPFGAFLGSDATGVAAVAKFQSWLGGRQVTVGHTYLPGDNWSDIEGDAGIIKPWAAWAGGAPERMLVLNVPMVAPNEGNLSDGQVADLMRQGAAGTFNDHFRTLAQRLVAAGAGETIIVLGWEMNGTTYSSRCRPETEAWKAYWREIVLTMRGVEGAKFRFDFAPTRGLDDVPWTQCYPGDDVVDIIGMDSYDQEPGRSFGSYITEPYGLDTQVRFAAEHHKPVSYPEWGLFRYGDDPGYVQGMHDWFAHHDVLYETITDYCPHGVWGCSANPRSSDTYRRLFGSHSP